MDFNRNVVTKSPQETARLGQEMGNSLEKCKTVCLYGELGSGKTTFAQGFAKALGISSRLLSPTFIIVRRYKIPSDSSFLYHIDLYRMNTKKDLIELGLGEILIDPDSVVLIEWAEKLGRLLPKKRIDVRFSVFENGCHHVSICNRS